MFQIHHVIAQSFRSNDVIQLLADRFSIQGPSNLLALPSDPLLAEELGTSPHNGGPLGSYTRGIADFLEGTRKSNEFSLAQSSGDAGALNTLAANLNNFVNTIKVALINGDLYTNTPAGMTAEEANSVNGNLFANWRDYAASHAAQIKAVDDMQQGLVAAGKPEAARYVSLLSSEKVSMADKFAILADRGIDIGPQQFTAFNPNELPTLPGFEVPTFSLPQVIFGQETMPAEQEGFAPTTLPPQPLIFVPGESLPTIESFPAGPVYGSLPPIFSNESISGLNLGDVGLFAVSIPIALAFGSALTAAAGARALVAATTAAGMADAAYANPEAAPNSPVRGAAAGPITGDTLPVDATNLAAVSGQLLYQDAKGNLVADTTGFTTYGIADPPVTTTVDTVTVAQSQGSQFRFSAAQAIDYASYENYSYNYDGFGSVDFSEPVVLDLTGNGINITQLTSSGQFFDLTGDGYKNHTAWAGAGNGVLVLDASGSGTINSPLDFKFTLWDPTARSDMQALRDVFDTNHNGKLDPGDSDWGMFKVLVTNPNGTTTLATLAQLGITSIDLTTNNADIVLPDGSKIVGETTFTVNGVTRTAADVSLAFDSGGYATQQTTTTNNDGSTTIDVKAFNGDGSLAQEIKTTTSADGLSRTIQFDNNGDGLFDQTQSDVTAVHSDSSRTETLIDSNAAGVVTDRTVTTTSADGRTVTINRDHTGNGTFDQTETHGVNSAGATVITISDRNPDGSLKDQLQTTVSADGLSKTVQTDLNGDGQFDEIHSDLTVIHPDGSRTETVTDRNNDNSLRDSSTMTTTANGLTKTIVADRNGDGATDLNTISGIMINSDGSSTTTQQVLGGDDTTLIAQTVTVLTANGLTRTTKQDFDGNTVFDRVTTDQTVNNADGSTTETVTVTSADSADATLISKSVAARSVDGRTRTITADTNGDGVNDRVETIAVNASGTVDTVTDTNPDGSFKDETVTTTSADGLSITTQFDSTGRRDADSGLPIFDLTTTDNTAAAQSGTSFTATNTNFQYGNGWTTFTTNYDANGNIASQTGIQQGGTSWQNLYNVAGTRYEVETFDLAGNLLTQTIANANGTYTFKAFDPDNQNQWSSFTIQYDAGWNVTSVPTGTNHDNSTFQSYEAYNALDTLAWYSTPYVPLAPPAGAVGPTGSRTETVTSYSSAGAMIAQTAVTTSADGLSKTIQGDSTGNGLVDRKETDNTVVNADGSRTETVSDFSQNGSLLDKVITNTSANRLNVTVTIQANGSGIVNETRSTATSSNGSVVQTLADYNANGSLRDETVTTASATGLSIITQSDTTGQRDGSANSVFDHTRTDVTVLNANGNRTETVTDTSANGSLVDQTVTTTSATGFSIMTQSDTTGQVDSGGNPMFDHTRNDLTAFFANGNKTETITDTSANATLVDRTVITTSGNGLSVTIQTDSTGASSFDETRTDVTALSTNGDKTETVTGKNNNGSTRDRTVTTTNANGNVSITRDINGDGATDQTETITLAANGNRIDTVSDLAANGVLKDRTIVTTSATGQSVTTQRDTNGDGTIDQTRTDVTANYSTGDRGETITDYDAAGNATDEIVVTTAADGLAKTTQWNDSGIAQTFDDGTSTFSLTETDVTTLNPDGSTVRTISDSGPRGVPIKQFTTITSADHNTVTVQRIVYSTTTSGAIQTSATDVTQRNTDGSVVSTISDYNGGVTLIDRSIVTTGANGLSTTTQCDNNGDGTIDQTRTDLTALNTDGSKIETVTDYNAANVMVDRTVTTASANGLTMTTQYDLTGSGTFGETKTDATTIDAYGGTTETSTYQGANGALTAEYVQSTSANGLSVSKQWDTAGQHDANGNPIFDQTATDVTVLNAGTPAPVTITNTNNQYGYGWTTFTVSYDGSGNITSETGVQTSGASWQNIYNVNGAGSYEVDTYDSNHNLETRSVTNSDGTHTLTATDTANFYQWSTFTIHYDANWNPIQGGTSGTNHNGSAFDPSEAFGAFDTLTWYANPYVPITPPPPASDGASGSRTETQTAYVNGAMLSQASTTTSANGLSKTIQKDTTGNGTFDQTQTIVDGKNADGSTSETVTDYNANGSVKDSAVTTTSADGRTVTVQRDSNGDGAFDQVQTTFANVDGSTVSTTTDLVQGAVSDKTIVTTSVDGLTKTTAWQFNGNNHTDRTGSDVTVVNLDGSRTETIIDTNSDGSLDQRGIGTTSADGRTRTLQEDNGGAGFFDVTATTTVAADGSTTTLTQHWGANSSLLGYSNTTVSADGLTETVLNYTPANVLVEQDVTKIRIDGSQVTNATLYDSTGNTVIGHRVATHSANGLFDSIQLSLSSGNSDETVNTNIDNSSQTTVTDLNPDGSEKDQVITETAADREGAIIEESVANGDSEPTLVTGDVDAMTATPSGINVTGNAALIVDGIGDTINLDPYSGAKLTVIGTDDVVNASGDLVTLDAGAGVTVNGPGDIIDINGTSATVTVSNATINDTSSAAATVIGSNDAIALNPSSGASVTVTGANDVVNAPGDMVTLTANETVMVTGSSATIVATSGGDIINITGANDQLIANNAVINDGNLTGTAVTGSGNTINLDPSSGASATVTGANDIVNAIGDAITLGANSSVTVNGSSDVVTGNSGGDSITLTGSNDVLSVTNDAITMAASSAATITGTGDIVNASGDTINTGAGTTLTVSGSSDMINVMGANDTLTASNDAINGGSFAGTSVIGSSDTINLNPSSGAGVTVTGSGDTVIASGDAIALGANSSVTVNGSSDAVTGNSGGDTITLTGSNDVLSVTNDTITMAASSAATITGTGDTVNASNDTITTGANTSLTVSGSGDAISVTGTNDTLTASNATITVNTSSGASVTVNGASDTVNASNDTVTLGANSSVTINGSSDAVIGNSGGDTITLTGSNDVLSVTNDTITVNTSSGANVTVTGASDTVNASNDTISIGANSSVAVNGSSDTITTGANTSLTVSGSGDAINVTGTNDFLTASNATITMNAGNGAIVAVAGPNDTVIANNDSIHLGSQTGTIVSGSGDTITLDPNSGASVVVSGVGNAVLGAGDTVEVTSGKTYVYGDFAQVRADDFSTVDVFGNGDTITASRATIFLESNQIVRVLGNDDLIEFNGTNDGVMVSHAADIIVPNGDPVAVEGTHDVAQGIVNWYGDVTGDIDNNQPAVESSGDDPFAGFDFDPPEDPLVISTDRNGVRLVALAQSQAVFDYAGDGTPRPTGWFGAGTGMLVYDKNGNGVIDDASELLGNRFAPAVTTGFAALAILDSNHDGVIDANDPAFAHLEIWEGTPGPNGKSQPGQLFSLSDVGIKSIGLAATPASINVNGNEIIALGTLTFTDGTSESVEDVMFDTNVAPSLPVAQPPASIKVGPGGTVVPASASATLGSDSGPMLGPLQDKDSAAVVQLTANDTATGLGGGGSASPGGNRLAGIDLGGIHSVIGSPFDDTLGCIARNNLLDGGEGNDNVSAATGVPAGEIRFGGFDSANPWFVPSADNPNVDALGSRGSQIALDNWFWSPGGMTPGGVRLDSQVSQLVQAMAAYSAPDGSDLSFVNQVPNDPALAGGVAPAWHQ